MMRPDDTRKSVALRILLPVAFLAMLAGPGWAGGGAGRNVKPDEAQALIRENAGNRNFVVLDVRTPREFAQGHLEGAVLIDYHSPGFREELAGLDRTKSYLVYCRTGNRSSRALGLMEKLGFPHTYHLEGGIRRWLEEGLPAVR